MAVTSSRGCWKVPKVTWRLTKQLHPATQWRTRSHDRLSSCHQYYWPALEHGPMGDTRTNANSCQQNMLLLAWKNKDISKPIERGFSWHPWNPSDIFMPFQHSLKCGASSRASNITVQVRKLVDRKLQTPLFSSFLKGDFFHLKIKSWQPIKVHE